MNCVVYEKRVAMVGYAAAVEAGVALRRESTFCTGTGLAVLKAFVVADGSLVLSRLLILLAWLAGCIRYFCNLPWDPAIGRRRFVRGGGALNFWCRVLGVASSSFDVFFLLMLSGCCDGSLLSLLE